MCSYVARSNSEVTVTSVLMKRIMLCRRETSSVGSRRISVSVSGHAAIDAGRVQGRRINHNSTAAGTANAPNVVMFVLLASLMQKRSTQKQTDTGYTQQCIGLTGYKTNYQAIGLSDYRSCHVAVPSSTTLATMRCQSPLSSQALMSCVGLTLSFNESHRLSRYFSL